jgi:hypothetical protein
MDTQCVKMFGFVLLVTGLLVTSGFILHSYQNFKMQQGFTSVPLSFDPYTSTSSYEWNGGTVSIQGGFVKGKIAESGNQESLLLRSLSTTPTITIKSQSDNSYRLRLENISPSKIETGDGIENLQVIDAHTIFFTVDVKANQSKTIHFSLKSVDNPEVVILGDNRNGYGTFSTIIDQVNGINPAFVIDNGDLVYGGEPNKYRLFYELYPSFKSRFIRPWETMISGRMAGQFIPSYLDHLIIPSTI